MPEKKNKTNKKSEEKKNPQTENKEPQKLEDESLENVSGGKEEGKFTMTYFNGRGCR